MTDLCKFQQYACTMGKGENKAKCIFVAYCRRIRELEAFVQKVADEDYDDFSGNPARWSSTAAMKLQGWEFKDGKAIPPKKE